MPDVSRSDSQRSDASQRPRVSFNRDVHVKRIGKPGTPRVVGALAGDGEGHLVPLAVRRERPTRLSRRELAREAERVLQQADSVQCTSSPLPDINHRAKYSTLPPLRSRRHPRRPRLPAGSPSSSPEPGKRRGLVASLFSSLERSRTKPRADLKKTSSTSLSDLLQTSSSSPERAGDTATRGTKLARSASDSRKAPRGRASLDVPDFSSLSRATARKSRSKFGNNTDNLDRSPSPPPRRNRKNVLKKSHSDSESPTHFVIPEHVQADVGGKKSQLSPIIEASPHDDYFEDSAGRAELKNQDDEMHSSQMTARPPLTRGKTVDVMVKRLSQDATLSRAPPRRFNSPAGLVAPGEERQHNNNMPFSYTRPTQGTPTRGRAAPTAEGGQVIYAEVVVGGGGSAKQTVHTQIPVGKHQLAGGNTNHDSVSDEDEGLGLSMDGFRRGSADFLDVDARTSSKKGFDSFDRDYSPKVNGYRSQVREFINNEKDDNKMRSTSRVVSDMRVDYGSKGLGSSVFKKEYVVQESSSYDSGNYILDPPGRGRADGMDSWKKEALLETNRYENEYNRMRENDRKTPASNNFSGSYSKSDNYEKEYSFNTKYVKNEDDNDVAYRSDRLKKDPLIEPHIIDRSDLSSRRNRLESRIESHRKDRLLNSKFQQKEKRDILLEPKVNENNIKYLSDHKNNTDTTFSNRREFLNSQIDFDSGRIRNDKKYESEKFVRNNDKKYETENIARTNFYNESLTEVDGHGKKDLFADSGIEMDYRKDSSATVVNKYNETPRARSRNNESPTKITVNKWQSSNVTRVDLNGHSNDRLTDDEDIDPRPYKPSTTKHSSYTKEMTTDSFVSARLVKEQKKTTEAIPSSTVLIRHFAPGRGSPEHPQERRHKYDDVEQREESPERDWKTEKRSRRIDEQQVKRREEEEEEVENNKSKDDVPKKEDKKKKESEVTKTIDKKTDVKKTKKKQVTAMDKMRQLFTRSDTKTLKKSKKKEDKVKIDKQKEDVQDEVEEDPLTTRYSEYKGSNVEDTRNSSRTSNRGERRLSSDVDEQQDVGRSRERLATPSPIPPHSSTLGRREDKNKPRDASWFKSLDRKSSKHATKIENIAEVTTEDEVPAGSNGGSKSLRFFGDTDVESVSVSRGHAPVRRYKSNNTSANRLQVPQRVPGGGLRNHHRHHRSTGDVGTSSAESTTEGDSSQQSQKSVVYLHAATVGDIPNRNLVARSQRRAQSREELSSVASSHRLQPQTRTVSRSISVLAPWRPRHFKDNMEVHYENESPHRSNGKPPKIPASHQSNGASTMSRTTTRRKTEDSARASPQKQKVGKAMSVESLSHQDSPVGSRSQATKKRNLSTSIESLSQKNGTAKTQQNRMSKKNSALNASAMELSNSRSYKSGTAKKIGDSKKNNAKLARSASMPKDTRSSGWFKLKSKKQAT